MNTSRVKVASKIRYLQEYHNRVLHNIYPVPSGTDIANTLKYFSQTLLSILSRTGKKESQDASNLTVPMTMCLFPVPFPLTPSLRPQVSSINPTVTRSLLYSVLRDAPSERSLQSRDAHLSDYPSLDYQGLYVTLVTLLDLVPLLQHGQHVDLGQSIFYTTTCLLPFLNDDILSTLPYTMISTLATFPPFLHKDIIEYLSTSFLPMAILGSSRREGVPAHVNLSASSMLMIAMQYTSNPVYHCQLLECLMKYKHEVWKDLLYVIAYGPSQVKPPAVQMLFHYWPNLKPPGAISEYRGLQYTAWNPIHCQHIECHNAINKPAVKMCIDPSLSVALGDKPPPLYLCEECSQRIAGDHSEWLIDVLLPQAEISAICQKKNCSSHVRRAVVTCFSAGCCDRHGNRPVRYCKRCHSNHHSNEVGAASETHLYQTSPPPINTRECGAEELVCAVEAVISLLKEAEFHAEQREHELNRRRQLGLSSSHHSLENADFDNKDDDKHDQRLLSQFGIWFLVSLCTPSENTPTESLARLVAMVFQWFHSTAYMTDDEVGSLVEKLKPQFVTKWLKTVCDVRFDVMVMCLLPKPMEFARVGGYWDKSCSTVTQLKEGLNRILCLIPYNVINQSVWECIMPEWLEAIRTEVPDNQLKEFREVLSKMFDIELCPLPFSMEEMFGFISCRFTGYPSSVQEQALLWLHVLSELDITVPLQLLISMFSDGVNSVKELANQRKSRVNELAGNLAARRVSVASDPGRRVQHNMLSPFHSPFQSPFRSPMRSPFRSPFKNFGHPGGRTIDFDCEDDEMNLNCFILMFDLLLKQMELQDDGITMGLEHSISKDIISIINNVFQPWGGSHTCQKDEKAIECNLCQASILCYQLACELLGRLAPKEESRLVEPTDSLEDSLLSSRPEFTIGPEGEEEENPASKRGENPGNHTEPTEHAGRCTQAHPSLHRPNVQNPGCLANESFPQIMKGTNPGCVSSGSRSLSILLAAGACHQQNPPILPSGHLARAEHAGTEAMEFGSCAPRVQPGLWSGSHLSNLCSRADWLAQSWEGGWSVASCSKAHLHCGILGINHSLSQQQILFCDYCVGFIVGPGVSYSDQGNNVITTACLVGIDCFCMDCINGRLSVSFGPSLCGVAIGRKMWVNDKDSGCRLFSLLSCYNLRLFKHLVYLSSPSTYPGSHHSFRSTVLLLLSAVLQGAVIVVSSGRSSLILSQDQPPPLLSAPVLLLLRGLQAVVLSSSVVERPVLCPVCSDFSPLLEDVLFLHFVARQSDISSIKNIFKAFTLDKIESDIIFIVDSITDVSCSPTPTPPTPSPQPLVNSFSQHASCKCPATLYHQGRDFRDADKEIKPGVVVLIKFSYQQLPVTLRLIYTIFQPCGFLHRKWLSLKPHYGNSSMAFENYSFSSYKSNMSSEIPATLVTCILHKLEILCHSSHLLGVHYEFFKVTNSFNSGLTLEPKDNKNNITRGPVHKILALVGSLAAVGRASLPFPGPPHSLRISKNRPSELFWAGTHKVLLGISLSLSLLFSLSVSSPFLPPSPSLSLIPSVLAASQQAVPVRRREIFLSQSPYQYLDKDSGIPILTSYVHPLTNHSIFSIEALCYQFSIFSFCTYRLFPRVQNHIVILFKNFINQLSETRTRSTWSYRSTMHFLMKPQILMDSVCLLPRLASSTTFSNQAESLLCLSILFLKQQSVYRGRNMVSSVAVPQSTCPFSLHTFIQSAMNKKCSETCSLQNSMRKVGSDMTFRADFLFLLVTHPLITLGISFLMLESEGQGHIIIKAPSFDMQRWYRGYRGNRTHQSPIHSTSTNPEPLTPQKLPSFPTRNEHPPSLYFFSEKLSLVASDTFWEDLTDNPPGFYVIRLDYFISQMKMTIRHSIRGLVHDSLSFLSLLTLSMMVPGNAAGVAKQFLRCIFHQLAPNGIFPQLFQSTIKDGTFLRTLATSLMDFNELSSIAALSQLLEGLNNKKNLPAGGAMIHCLENIATFMEALPMDSPSSLWTTISNQFQTFFVKLPGVLPLKCSLDSSLRIMICLLKIPSTNATRSLLEPFSKLLSFVIQNAVFTLAYLVEVCGLCYRAFTKERDKLYLSRSVVLELLQALKLKSPLPDTNLLLLVQLVCCQIRTILSNVTLKSDQSLKLKKKGCCGTAAMECVRQSISEVLDFMADMHTLTKLKNHMKACSQPLHEDTFGGHLKVGLAQIAAMEISRGNHRDNKAVIRYLPWLYHPPSAMQQGPKEFIECVSHIRLLSWLLLGSLTHNAVCPNASSPCLPIPLDAGSHIADHLIVILIGFPEQSKTSVLHMCSLFHAFIFAQLWTVYCEQSAVATNVQNQNEFSFTAILTALEFWSRVTPSILQLMAHNKVMVEMVCLHVISLMEALQECNSTIFVKLIPMWLPMIQSNIKHLSGGLQLRLQAIQNNVNHHSLRTLPGSAQSSTGLAALRKWLQCTRFKMAQVEIQSSEAASQFYPL
uniref:Unc-79 homolog, NALCN channel complex subunit n=1 Tax=Myotis lucifugus TaxID=59463 RepID=G1PSB3_MYOLU